MLRGIFFILLAARGRISGRHAESTKIGTARARASQIAAETKARGTKNSRKILPEVWGKLAQHRRPGIIEDEAVSGYGFSAFGGRLLGVRRYKEPNLLVMPMPMVRPIVVIHMPVMVVAIAGPAGSAASYGVFAAGGKTILRHR